MNDYRHGILTRISTELEGVEWQELPEGVRDFIGHYETLSPHIEYPLYLFTQLGEWQLIIGFGDTDPYMWDGTIYWQIQRDYSTSDYYSGEIANGSPRYVLWTLFDQLNEELKKGAN